MDEVSPLVQVKSHTIIRIHLYLLAHEQVVIDLELKLALKFFLLHLRFFSYEGLIAQVSDIVQLDEVLVLRELARNDQLDLLEVFLSYRLFSESVLESIGINELVLVDLVDSSPLSFVINVVHNINIAFGSETSTSSSIQDSFLDSCNFCRFETGRVFTVDYPKNIDRLIFLSSSSRNVNLLCGLHNVRVRIKTIRPSPALTIVLHMIQTLVTYHVMRSFIPAPTPWYLKLILR